MNQEPKSVSHFDENVEEELYFRPGVMPANAQHDKHRHWAGELIFSFSGVVEIRLDEQHFFAPSPYGVWVPAGTVHVGRTNYEASYCSLYVSSDLSSGKMPAQTCVLLASPLLRAIFIHLRQHPPLKPAGEDEKRLLRVCLDQLSQARPTESYLPTSEDPLLRPIMLLLEDNPGDQRTLAQLAEAVHWSQKTVARRFNEVIGMSFREWRQRLKIIRSLTMLEAGYKVEAIALELNYSTASSFIAMFRKLMGVTPAEFRKGAIVNEAAGGDSTPK